jgi:chitinase
MNAGNLLNKLNTTLKTQLLALLTLITLLAGGASCFASTITLQWDPETAPDLAGYKVYYSTSAAAPFTGAGATQGASPVNVTTATTATITGLDPAQAYYFAVTAYSIAGVESPYSNTVLVPELIPPTVSITSPANNATATGTVSVAVNATDNVGVARLEFYVNGVLQATDSSAPYLFSWNTSALASGVYTLSVKAYDAADNVGQSGNVSVTVVNDSSAPAVTLSATGNGAPVSGTLPISALATDDIAVTKVEFYANGTLLFASNVAPYRYNWNTAGTANGAYTLSAKAYDAAGNVGQSGNVSVSVLNDTSAPAVTLLAGGNGATVSGSLPMTAIATDDIAVTKVEFYANGTLLFAGSAAPYSYNWNTAGAANGAYTLSAKAYDAAGKVGQSTSTLVTVFNDSIAPVVSINPVAAPSTATSQAVSGSVSDNDAVASVTVQAGSGAAVAASITGGTWSFPLTGLAVGNNLVTVRATDRAGNSSQATATIVVQAVVAPTDPVPAALSIVDAQLALQLASSRLTPTSAQLQRLDVAPYVSNRSVPNGKIDTGDVVVILLKLVGKL